MRRYHRMSVCKLWVHTHCYQPLKYFFLMEASRCAYKPNVILNSVRQHHYFITEGNYIGYMFRL